MQSLARIPVATYRLQFNSSFTFRDARAIVDYLHALGVSDCYASSYLKAVPGSGHGYDVADPTRLNPEIGSDEEFQSWIDALDARGMSHVIDIVPNHMGIAQSANPWWLDVLENGPSSRFARFFDIEWHPVKDELADKVLIPVLGDQYGATLERQELTLACADGAFAIKYAGESIPIAPDSYAGILGTDLDRWIEEQGGELEPAAADELRSVINAAEHLPPRGSRSPDAIATRAREKEVVKRRLAAVLDASASLRAYVEATLRQYNGIPGQPRSFDRLDGLLNEQSYRLAHWRVASEEINYRRFFDVNQLAALRMEDPEVFEEVHRFVFDLVERGAARGLRVDHVDGLFAPGEYLERLRARSGRPVFLVVEKILAPDEQLPADWPVHGTTGYEFAAMVNALFVDGRHERAMDDIYHRFARGRDGRSSFDDLVYRCKKQVLHETMSGDINSIGHQLNRLSERNRHFRDFTLYSLISTLKEVIACFPVYRTYVGDNHLVAEHDRRAIARAVRCARRRTPGVSGLVFDFIERVLLGTTPAATAEECVERATFAGKFQQITSPVAAKGLEDSALYVYNRLLSLNEVGADPTKFGAGPSAVHQWMADRRARWPASLSATATHDTKRGEDVRARVNVLSEIPEEWKFAVAKWRALNRRLKPIVNGVVVPDGNEEYFLYQTLVGAWPFDRRDVPAFHERLTGYLVKALREAKVHSGWLSPDEEYEAGLQQFLSAILDPRRQFLDAFLPFQARVAELGIYNSLAQLLIKITAPGVPDFYQGTEFWDLSLVDPDNRRPVDYCTRAARLDALAALDSDRLADSLLDARADGRVKLWTTARALATRRAMREVFEEGEYLPLRTTGTGGESAFAFARRLGNRIAVTCVPRLVAAVAPKGMTPPIGRAVWADTRIEVPGPVDGEGAIRFRNVFTSETVCGCEGTIDAALVFHRFPVGLLIADEDDDRRV